ncbi:MAG: hypothetical protein AAF433_13750 [Bacteroidota bacterium]
MRSPLQKFTEFTNQLLPHETAYLLSIHQFKDHERLSILQRIDFNATQIEQFQPYDTSIDKRKYYHLTNWINKRLQQIDVDAHFNWMLEMEQKIMTDSILAEEEKQLLKSIRHYQYPGFYFSKFYELLDRYRDFLLIRLRYADHQLVATFLREKEADYLHAKQVRERILLATKDIVDQYSGQQEGSQQWAAWLTEIFYDEDLEGYLRYLALVRMVFISHNHRQYTQLRAPFDFLDQQFRLGRFYSKRLLLNYYNNRLMLHSNFADYDRAVNYGYLSVRASTHDNLLYTNNLCAVLLRLNRAQEALKLMQQASAIAKTTKNMHNRVGFVAFHMEAFIENGLPMQAERYGDVFLAAYSKEVLHYRWHLFFTIYLASLLQLNHNEKLLKTMSKYRLLERDQTYTNSKNYLPVLPFYQLTAQYREGLISQDKLLTSVKQLIPLHLKSANDFERFRKQIAISFQWIPALEELLKKMQNARNC